MFKKRKHSDTGGVVSDINVTPMVDIMLVILIIFMVITPLITKGVSVDLYKAENPINMEAADKEDAIVVALTRDGAPFLGGTKISKDQIPDKVKSLLEGKLDKTVYIKCDNRTRFEALTDVIDALRSAGVDQLGLLTDRLREKKAPAAAGSM
jgi:biopolymer transport protein ExbD/biopolymer transport protein TolR